MDSRMSKAEAGGIVSESPFKRHEPLYLKYRPQSLGQLVGQEGVYRTLVNAIEHNKLTHAYLFTGPRGTGKTSSARILAKSLNCKTAGKPTVEPCLSCSCCLEIAAGNSPAVFEIDAASNNSVDDARVLIERAPLKAVGGEFKVYIIDECHMLTKEAFNTLLKTIEEPPQGVVFILATTEEHKVLPTIVSRCQRLMFKLINQDALTNHLRTVAQKENIEIEDEALRLIARRSGGGLRDALSNLDQASLLAAPGAPATVSDLLRLLGALHEDILLGISKQIAERSGQAVIDSVSQLLAEGREPQVVLQELSRHFLSLMKASYLSDAKSDPSVLATVVLGSESYLSGLLEQSSLFERSELSQIVEQLDRLEQTCRRSSQPAMHLEIGLLGICHRHDIHLVKDLLLRVQQLEEKIAGGLEIDHSARPHHPSASRSQVAPPQYQASSPHNSVPAQSSPASPPSTSSYSATGSVAPAPKREAAAVGSSSYSASAGSNEPAPQLEPAASRQAVQAPAAENSQELVSISTLPAQSDAAAGEDSGASCEPAAAVYQDDDAHINQLNADIDYVWQQILDELQRRHLPTFSLTSTHAFPLSFNSKELNIGVMKENFQRMLESKVEHLRVATQAVTGRDLIVKIRVAAEASPAPKKNQPIARPAPARETPNQEPQETRDKTAPAMPSSAANGETPPGQESDSASESAGLTAKRNTSSANSDEFDATMVKEAYKIFEGPGSRRIT